MSEPLSIFTFSLHLGQFSNQTQQEMRGIFLMRTKTTKRKLLTLLHQSKKKKLVFALSTTKCQKSVFTAPQLYNKLSANSKRHITDEALPTLNRSVTTEITEFMAGVCAPKVSIHR